LIGDDNEYVLKIGTAFMLYVIEKEKGTVQLPIGKNELVSFMEEVENGLANGESFSDIMQKRIDAKVQEFYPNDSGITGIGSNLADIFFIDPNTGEIKYADSKGRNYIENNTGEADDDAAWDLAYDLQQFINATVFKPDDMSADEADKIVAEVKARQANKDTGRFDNPFGSVGYRGWVDMNTNMKVDISAAERILYEKLGVFTLIADLEQGHYFDK